MKLVGLLAGIGSMLDVGREQGWKIAGNVETRRVYHVLPWGEWNFPKTPWHRNVAAAIADPAMQHADLALGHPPCGSYSALGGSRVSLDLPDAERVMRQTRRAGRVGLLPEFAGLVNATQPRMFALDNLPKILKTVAPFTWWEATLPDYRISYVVIVNGDYGCVQRRQRLWIFGVRKDVANVPFTLRPIAQRPPYAPKTVLEALKGLPWQPWINDHTLAHYHGEPFAKPIGGFRSGLGKHSHLTEYIAEVAWTYLSIPVKHPWRYEVPLGHGRISTKVGWLRIDPLGYSAVLSGFPSSSHPLSGWQLTPRERARMMGWPDEFKLNIPGHPLNRSLFWTLTKVTGRSIPSEFVRFLLPQVARFLRRHA